MTDNRLIGAWELLESYCNGQPTPIFVELGMIGVYSPTHYWRRTGDLDSIFFPYEVNVEVVPFEIDLIAAEGRQRGIYKFEEDGKLVRCFCEDIGDARPTDFDYSTECGWNLGVLQRLDNAPQRFDGEQI